MHSDNAIRSIRDRGDLGDRDRRGVRCEYRLVFSQLVEFREEILLRLEVLDDRFNDEIRIRDRFEIDHGIDSRERFVHFLLRELLLVDTSLQVLRDRRHRAVQVLLFHVHQSDVEVRESRHVGDSVPHRAATDDTYLLHRNSSI